LGRREGNEGLIGLVGVSCGAFMALSEAWASE
jgi:hypothetical protein